MRPDPQSMLVFAAVARARGVRGAASALGTPRSTVSRRLAALEADLGAPLVVRTNRRFELTELGAALASRCERLEELLKDTDDFARRATDEPSGTLRIDAAPVLGEEVLPEIVDELLRRHPQLSVRVRLSADYTDLRRGAVDVALRAWSLEDATDLFETRLGSSTTGCWASPAYLEARGTPRAPKDLASHECILVGEATTGTWTFGAGARQERVEVGGRARVDSFRLARALAVRGAGVLRAARLFAEPLVASGALVPILERHWPETPVHAVHARGAPPPPKVRAFVDLARAIVGRVLARPAQRRLKT